MSVKKIISALLRQVTGFSMLIFLAIVALIPVNLGKHFLLNSSYVSGLAVDYLIPTLYVQDILAALLLVSLLISQRKNFTTEKLLTFFNSRENQLLVIFILSVMFSTFNAQSFTQSFTSFLRLFLYSVVFLYAKNLFDFKKYSQTFFMVLGISITLVSLLGILQYAKQGSVFNNYLVLGEQPYSLGTPGIVVENVFGLSKVGAYGLFRHPNAFAGFLCVTILLMLPFINKFRFLIVSVIFGSIALVLTFSVVAYVVFGISLFAYDLLYFVSLWPLLKRKLFIAFGMLFIFYCSFFLPLLHNSTVPSIFRRENLLNASYIIIKDHPLFGVGFNNFTKVIDSYYLQQYDYRFTQPVHNIFALMFAESGVFAFVSFLVLTLFLVRRQVYSKETTYMLLPLLSLIVIGCFDHYFVTSQQGLLLLMLIYGLASRQEI